MLTAEQIAELEAKHGEIAILNGPNGVYQVAFRKPKRAEWKLFRSNARNEAKRADAEEGLSMACIVYPERSEYVALLEKYPAIPDTVAFAKAIERLMALAAEEEGKG